MKRIRIGNDFVFLWTIGRNGFPEDLSAITNPTLVVRVLDKIKTAPFEIVGSSLLVEFTPTICDTLGVYNLEFSYELPDPALPDLERKCKVDVDAFQIVPKTSQADCSVEYSVMTDLAIALKGDKGDSSYKVWLDEGHSGTIDDYLAYLQQPALDAAEVANTAAGLADEKALLADNAATLATTKAGLANDAAALANEKATYANEKAIYANEKGGYALTQGDYAKEQGDYAKTEGNYALTQGDYAKEQGDYAKTEGNYALTQGDYAKGQGDYAKGIGDSYDAVKLDKTAVDIYNVTLAVPLPAGSYYNSTSARAAVPVAVRKKGLELIYETSAGIWYKERYVGVDVANWTVASNWEIVPLKSHIENNEEVIAEALVELKNKIDALQNIIKEMILGSVQIDNLDIVKNLNLYGSSNMILTGTAAPTVVPDFIGQFFIKTSATTACYQATGNSSVNDWKQIG